MSEFFEVKKIKLETFREFLEKIKNNNDKVSVRFEVATVEGEVHCDQQKFVVNLVFVVKGSTYFRDGLAIQSSGHTPYEALAGTVKAFRNEFKESMRAHEFLLSVTDNKMPPRLETGFSAQEVNGWFGLSPDAYPKFLNASRVLTEEKSPEVGNILDGVILRRTAKSAVGDKNIVLDVSVQDSPAAPAAQEQEKVSSLGASQRKHQL